MYQALENKALELLEENVNYDEAELGCNWGMEELKDFLKSHLKEAYEAGQEEGFEEAKRESYYGTSRAEILALADKIENRLKNIALERQAVRNERERIIKWAEKYMDKTTKYYGTDKHGIALDDLIQELTK